MSAVLAGTAISGPMLAMLGISALGTGASMYQSSKRGKGATGMTAPQVVTMPQYSFTQPRLEQTSDFLSQQMQNLQEGRYPQWYEKGVPSMRRGLQRGAGEWAYGGPLTGPGAYGEARAAGSATGVGPRATMAGTSKVSEKYANMQAAIDEFIAKTGIDISRETAKNAPYLSAMMPQGPSSQVIGGMGYNIPESPDYMGQSLQQMGQYLPYLMGGQQQQMPTFGYGGEMYSASTPPDPSMYPGPQALAPWQRTQLESANVAANPSAYSSYIAPNDYYLGGGQ